MFWVTSDGWRVAGAEIMSLITRHSTLIRRNDTRFASTRTLECREPRSLVEIRDCARQLRGNAGVLPEQRDVSAYAFAMGAVGYGRQQEWRERLPAHACRARLCQRLLDRALDLGLWQRDFGGRRYGQQHAAPAAQR